RRRLQHRCGRAHLSVVYRRAQDAARARRPGILAMPTLDSLLLGFSVALQPDVLWYAFLGCLVGTIVGVLPGIGPLSGISILLPATFGLDTTKSVVMLAGIYYGSQYGGSTTSILMRIPGEAASVMTCIDGYAMAQKGRAGAALCIAAVGSWVAGTFGVIMLTLIAPPLANFALRFGPPEYTALLVLDLAASHPVDGVRRAHARHHRHRQHDRAFPLFVRHPRARGRDRHRPGRGRPVRPGRDPVDTVRQHDPHGHRAKTAPAAAQPAGVAPVGHADRARLDPRLPGRAHARLRPYHLELPVLWRRAASLQASGGIRQGRGRRRRRTGIGQQCRLDRRVRADAGARPSHRPDHRGADRGADDPWRPAGPDAGERAPQHLLGFRR